MKMPTKRRMEIDLCLREEEHDFKGDVKRKTKKGRHNKFLLKNIGHH